MSAFPDLERALASVDGEIRETVQIMTAARVAGQHYPQLDPAQPLLLSGLSDQPLVERVRQVLLLAYPPEHGVTLVSGSDVRHLLLSELGQGGPGERGLWLFVPPLAEAADYAALQEVVARLRAPGGCPWDQALTWDKLRPSLLEETYELLAGLDAGSTQQVTEELGDLLLQIAMQTQIAMEEGRFRSTDVIRGIVEKLIRRHPHVFGDAKVSGAEEVLANWEAIKRTERESRAEKRSPLAGVPADLPALAQADAYLDRMSRIQKVDVPATPWAKLAAAAQETEVTPEQAGEALLEIVAWIRSRGVDAESALRAANARYAAAVEAALE